MRRNLLLPWERIILESSFSALEVEDRLMNAMDIRPKGKSWLFHYPSRNRSRQFTGTIGAGKFEIQRIIHYRNSFLPVIEGEITNYVYGTEIRLRFRLSLPVLVFMSVWLGVVFLICCGILFTWLATGFFNDQMWVPFAMFLFGYVLTVGAFKVESRIARNQLLDLLDAKEKVQ